MTEFESFIREGVYLRGWSPKTVRIYRQAWASFGHGSDRPDAVTDHTIADWVVSLKARGLRAPSINAYIRSLNAYLSFLRSRGVDCPRPVRQLKEPERPLKTVPVERLKGMLKRPCTSYTDHRMQTLLALLLDTGIRIREALDLRVHDLDLDSLLLTVTGKGQKTRVVPMSTEGRRVLFRFLQLRQDTAVPRELLFGHRDSGAAWDYQNCLRDLKRRWPGVTPHMLRHTFATRFIADGGSPFQLQRLLGHASLSTTLRYVHLQTEDLQRAHRLHGGVGKFR
jgi:site-specific recombinase XerD